MAFETTIELIHKWFKDSVRTKNLKKSEKTFFPLSDIIFYDNSKNIYKYAESMTLRMVITPLSPLSIPRSDVLFTIVQRSEHAQFKNTANAVVKKYTIADYLQLK